MPEDLSPQLYEAALTTPDPESGKRLAAARGAAAAGITGALAVGSFYALSSAAFPYLARTLGTHAPQLVPLLLPILGILGPVILALPAIVAASVVAGREGRRDRDRGMAAAAGAGIGASAGAATALGAMTLALGSVEGLLLLLPFYVSAALAVGLVGAAAFARVPPRAGEADPGTPALYQGLTAAGLGIFGLLAAGPMWAALANVFPFLSPSHMFASLGIVGTTALTLGALAPITYGIGRGLAGGFRRPRRRVIGYGLIAATLFPSVLYGWLALWFGGPLSLPLVLTCGGFALGAIPHALAVYASLRPPPRPALPPAE